MKIFYLGFFVLTFSFVVTRNPTPQTDELVDKLWPKYSTEGEEYMDIGQDLMVRNSKGRLNIWHKFQQRFTNHT